MEKLRNEEEFNRTEEEKSYIKQLKIKKGLIDWIYIKIRHL